MLNILIIPSEKEPDVNFALKIAEIIKHNFSEVYVSTLVSVDTYDEYYESGIIDGFIIRPKFFFDKIFLFDSNHFDLAIMERGNVIWKLACKQAKIKAVLSKIDPERPSCLINIQQKLEYIKD